MMTGNGKSLSLSELEMTKLPLRYGTEACYITLTDDRYTAEIVELRNTAQLGKYVNYVELSTEDHRRWLGGQLERDDALNFVLVARQRFAGTLSLYNIEHGKQCELGRVMMPDDGSRLYALAVDVLGMSFAFDILGMRTLYCVVDEGNRPVWHSQLKNGWKIDPRYERFETVNGRHAHLIGLSVDRSEWSTCYEKMRPLAKRLLTPAGVKAAEPAMRKEEMNGEKLHPQCEGSKIFIHKLADVKTRDIGEGTRIWQFVVALAQAKIGADCNICAHVFIENDVVVGNRVTVKSGVQLWNGLRVGDDVFIGPNATFTNDMFPRSGNHPQTFLTTTIEPGASVGAGAIILPGLTIGTGAMIGAGAVVTKNVAARSLVHGNPARHVRFLEQ